MPPQIIASRYEIGSKIGSGGIGDVFRGTDRLTGRPVAIKALKYELATAEMIARFVREGEALRQLNHPNIVAILDAVQEEGQHYLIMELIGGGTLNDILEPSRPLPVRRLLDIALDLADALTRAHRLNIIHRDIKPSNVLIAEDGTPRLSDFGIARVRDSNITETGSVMGTVAYIAPELLQGRAADARSDIWSLGVMLFEMLTGQLPFNSNNPGGLIHAIINASLPDIESLCADAPDALVDLIYRMLVKNPEARIPRMRLVGAELEAILAGDAVNITPRADRAFPAGDNVGAGRFDTESSPVTKSIKNNLPIQTTPFVGRETELVELEQLLKTPHIRLVTILAPGGMGKTRLSLEVAAYFANRTSRNLQSRAFENGIYFVDLAPLTSADNILSAVAEAVSYSFQQDDRDSRHQLFDYLREKNILLIMDNFEHVVAGRTLVQEILQAASDVKILVTSREKLNLSLETVFALSGMEFPDWETPEDALEYSAVKLFMQSAQRVQPGFALQSSDLGFIARICRMAQGMPLAILLAAAWLEVLSLHEIAEEINRSVDFLETEMHDLPERQRSIRAVFEYSWNLLTETERQLLSQLSIFRGGFTREAAQQITGATLRDLSTLVNKSLLRRDVVSGRYELHELLRQYAEEKLIESGSGQTTHTVYAHYYTRLLHQLTPKLKGHGQLEALTLIESDFENIRAAWTWAVEQRDAEAASIALEGLYLFLTYRSRVTEGEQLFRSARQAWLTSGDNPPLLAGQVLVRFPDAPQLPNFRRGLEIARQHNHASEIAFCQRLVGHWLSHTEFNQDEGIPMLEASLKNYRMQGETFYIAQILDDLGWSYNLSLQSEKQNEVVQESLDLRRQIGDKIGMANSLRNMGGSAGGFFDSDGRAIRYWQEAKEIAYEMNDRLGIAWNAGLQATTAMFMGDFKKAVDWIEEGYPHAVDINDPVVKGFIQITRGIVVSFTTEDYEQGLALIESGYDPDKPDFRTLIASFAITVVACGLRKYDIVRPYLRPLTDLQFFSSTEFLPLFVALPQYAFKLAEAGKKERAAEVLGKFDNQQTIYDFPMPVKWAEKWSLITRLRADLETELGSERYHALWERGKSLEIHEIAQEMLRELL